MSPKNNVVGFSKEQAGTTNSGRVVKYIGLAVVLFALLGLIFTSFGPGFRGGAGGPVFGRYGDRDILYQPDNTFGQAVESSMSNYNAGIDSGDDFYTFIRYIAWQEAFSSVVYSTAISYHLDRSGYQPSSRAVDRRVIEYGPYRTNGEFDESKYLSTSQARRNIVRDLMREQLVFSTWSEDVLDGQYHSTAQIDFLWEMRTETKSYNYITIPFSEFPDQSVLEYGNANSGLFVKMPVSRITVSDEETAKTVVGEYEQNRSIMNAFADLASEYSLDGYKDNGGSMGPVYYHELSADAGREAADAVFSSSEGDISGPYETQYGWMIIRADGQVDRRDPNDLVDDIRAYMLENEVGLVEDALIARAEELRLKALAAGDFVEAAAQEGYAASKTAPFPVNYAGDSILGTGPENSGDPILSGTSSSDDFWEKIIPLQRIGEVSRPVVLNDSVAVFSLATNGEPEERLSYWDALIDYEVARSRQDDFRSAVLSEQNRLFQNDFNTAYDRIFGSQG